MRAGIRDILSPDAEPAQIRVMLERACQSFASRNRTAAVSAAGGPKGLVIGVFSPKGGVGKTTIATNIAIGLGKVAPMSVVIVDLDLQFGDVASGLYLHPEHTVTDAVSSAASHDSLVLKAFLTVHPGSIYALCAPRSPEEADDITPRAGDPAAGAARGTVPVRGGGHGPGAAGSRPGRHGAVHGHRLGDRHGRSQHPRAALRPRTSSAGWTSCRRPGMWC